jgi:hypothetical protein
MLVPFQKARLAGAFLATLLVTSPAPGKDVYKASLDPAIPHHAAILDTLSKIEKDPSNAQLHNDLGCLVAWDGFWRDALRSFDTAASLAPKDSRPRFNAGLVQALRGEWGAARSRFRKAVKIDPGNWSAWWMLGFAEENLGHEDAAVDAYSRSLRVDTSLFDPKFNPFAVATRLKARALLDTYETRRVDASLPFSNQLADPSRVASFFQARSKAAVAVVQIEEPPRTGPVVTSVPPLSAPRPVATPSPEPAVRRRRAYGPRGGAEREGGVEVAPEPPREPTGSTKAPPGPGFGEGSGAPRSGATPPPGTGTASPAPGLGGGRRLVSTPAPGATPPPDDE